MQLFFFFNFVLIFLLSFTNQKLTLEFQRTIIINQKNKTQQIIQIKTSASELNSNFLIYFSIDPDDSKKYTCLKLSDNFSQCTLNGNGNYSFYYNDTNESTIQKVNQKVIISESFENIFDFSILKNCYSNKEQLIYELKSKNEYFSTDNIQIKLKNSDYDYFDFEKNNNYYILNNERISSNYDLYIIENDDFDDYLYLKKNIQFTDVIVDNYFFPSLNKIQFSCDCDFEPKIFSFNQKDNITCNLSSYFDKNEKKYLCYFNEKITKYNELILYYNNIILSDNIFSSKLINEVKFQIESKSINKNFREYYRINISNPENDFYLDSINSIYINFTDNSKELLKYNKDNNEDNSLIISDDYKSLLIDITYEFGYSYYLTQLERKTYIDETIENATSIHGNNFTNDTIIYYNLDDISFEPNYIVVGYIHSKFDYSTSKLVFINENAFLEYGSAFCYNIKNENNLKSTIQFYCEQYNSTSYNIISPINEPGILKTQLKKYTKEGQLNIIRFDLENDAQDIYNDIGLLDNVFLNFYIPNNDNNDNNINILYNDKEINKSENVNIEDNNFDYKLVSFIIDSEDIKEDGIANIKYGNNSIKNISISYSNLVLPTLINNYFRSKDEKIEIKFSNSFSNINQIKNSFFLWSGKQEDEYEDYCEFKKDNQTLICSNEKTNAENKYLYYKNKWENIIKLDYNLHNVTFKSKIGISRFFYILPEDQSIQFYFYYESDEKIFPFKVFVNNEEIPPKIFSETRRNYLYSTNKEGNYEFSYLINNNETIKHNQVISVIKSINDIFEKIEPEKKCVYYQNSINYNIIKKSDIDISNIKYKYLSNNYTSLNCLEDNCTILNISSNNSPRDIDIIFISEYDTNYPYLYQDSITFTDISTNGIIYSSKDIILYSDCLLDNLMILGQDSQKSFHLNCSILSKKQYICQIDTLETLLGLYYINQNGKNISSIYFNIPIEDSDFIIEPNETHIGINNFIITSNDFNLESILKIEVSDNDNNIQTYELNSNNLAYSLIKHNNTITLSLAAYPDKKYSIQLYNEIGFSKSYLLNKTDEKINITFDKVYYVNGLSDNVLISIEGNYSNKIEYIYYMDNTINTYSNDKKISGIENSINLKIFNFKPQNKGTYYFGYSLYNDKTIYNILNKKVISVKDFTEIILLFPPENKLISKDFQIDIVPKMKINLKVYIADINNQPVQYFSYKKGSSLYYLNSEQMKIFTIDANYTFVVIESESGDLLYKNKISFSDFEFENSYYLSNKIITIKNTKEKIDNLVLWKNDSYYTLLEKKSQFLNKELKTISIPIPSNIIDNDNAGYYIIKFEYSEIANIFLSKDISNSTFTISSITGSNNVIIKSTEYYLPNIISITLKIDDNNIIIEKKDIEFVNNEYIKFHLDIEKNSTIIINEIIELCPNSNSEECKISINQNLEFDEIKNFYLNNQYKVVEDDEVDITLNFNLTNPSDNEMNDIISKIFVNNKLIDKTNCSFNKNIVKCKILNTGIYEVLNINYNEFQETNEKYSLLYYQFDGPSCILEGNNYEIYYLNVLNYPYLVYLNDKKLEKYDDNYILNTSDFIYGENYIYYRQYELENPIKIFSFNYHEQYTVTIGNSLNEDNRIKFENGILIKINTLSGNKITEIDNYINNLVLNYNNKNEKINLKNCLKYNSNIFICTNINIPDGNYEAYYENVCNINSQLGNIDISNNEEQKLLTITPNYININDENVSIVTLEYSKKFENDVYSILFVDAESGASNNFGIFKPNPTNGKILTFHIPHDKKIKDLIGNYKIKVNYRSSAIPSLISKLSIVISDRLSLYENKQTLVKSSKINTFGIIFKSATNRKQIKNITYNDIDLEYSILDEHKNIIKVNITNSGIDFNKTGNYIFYIYENDIDIPLIFTIEIIEIKDFDSGIIFNHYLYKKTDLNYAYITISVNDDILIMKSKKIGGSNYNLTQYWSNSFLLVTNETGTYNFYINNNELIKDINVTVVEKNSFIPKKNIIKNHINYCNLTTSLENEKICFPNLKLNVLNYLTNSSVLYKISSFDSNYSNSLIEYNNLMYLPNDIESNKNYIIDIIRKDSEGEILLYQEEFSLTNITVNSLTYQNQIIKADLTLFCFEKEFITKLAIKNSNMQNCNYYNNKLICSFIINLPLQESYNLIYDSYFLNEILISKNYESFFDFYHQTLKNGKERFIIYSNNSNYGIYNITKVLIGDDLNDSNNLIFDMNNITYNNSNDTIYVDLIKSDLSTKIYIKSIELFDGLIYTLQSKLIVNFNKIESISNEYLYSYENYDNIKFSINSSLTNFYLIKGNIETELICSKLSNKYFSCSSSSIEYGNDYIINYYDNIVLHTIKYSIENRCQIYSNQFSSTLILKSSSEIPNIKEISIKLFNSNTSTEIDSLDYNNNFIFEDNYYFYKIQIKKNNLGIGNYYITFNNSNFSDYIIKITNEIKIEKIIGELFSNYNNIQYFIIVFNESIEINDIILSNENNRINGFCESMLNNTNSVLCKINSIIPNGTYILEYIISQCDSYIKSNTNIKVLEPPKIIPIPKIIKYDINKIDKEDIEITFNDNEQNNNNLNFILIKTDSLEEEININFSNKKISIPENISLGNYIFKTVYSNEDKKYFIIFPYLIVYDSYFDIINYSPPIKTQPFSLSDIVLQFNISSSYHQNQMKNIYFVKDNKSLKKLEKIPVNFNFNDNNKTLTFNNKTNNLDYSQYHIEIIGDIKTIYYYIHYIQIPEKIYSTTTSTLLINKNNNYIDFKAPTYFQNLITEIETKRENQYFKLYYCQNNICRIGRKSNSQKLTESMYLIIEFKDINNKTLNCTLGITIYPEIYFENFFPITNNSIYETYKSDDYGEDTYITYLPNKGVNDRIITLANYNAFKTLFPQTSYNYYFIDSNTNSLNYVYNIYGKNKNHTLLMRHPTNKNKVIKSKISFIECKNPNEIISIKDNKVTCLSCSQINPLYPYKDADNNNCVSKCSHGYLYKKNNACYSNCKSINTTKCLY